MAEQTRAATPAEATVTLVESEDDHTQQDVHTVRLRLRKPESKKKVQWQSGTVDNEHMNKKKSKCCCQYEKPHAFDESSSSSEEDECENCHGHVERKKKKKKKEPPGSTEDSAEPALVGSSNSEDSMGKCHLHDHKNHILSEDDVESTDSGGSVESSNPRLLKASSSSQVSKESSNTQVPLEAIMGSSNSEDAMEKCHLHEHKTHSVSGDDVESTDSQVLIENNPQISMEMSELQVPKESSNTRVPMEEN